MREKKKHKSVETAKRRKWCSTVLGNLDSLRPRRLYTIIVLSFSLTVAPLRWFIWSAWRDWLAGLLKEKRLEEKWSCRWVLPRRYATNGNLIPLIRKGVMHHCWQMYKSIFQLIISMLSPTGSLEWGKIRLSFLYRSGQRRLPVFFIHIKRPTLNNHISPTFGSIWMKGHVCWRNMFHRGDRDELRLRSRTTVGKCNYRPTSSLSPHRECASSFVLLRCHVRPSFA